MHLYHETYWSRLTRLIPTMRLKLISANWIWKKFSNKLNLSTVKIQVRDNSYSPPENHEPNALERCVDWFWRNRWSCVRVIWTKSSRTKDSDNNYTIIVLIVTKKIVTSMNTTSTLNFIDKNFIGTCKVEMMIICDNN